jgi:hypothetical protein
MLRWSIGSHCRTQVTSNVRHQRECILNPQIVELELWSMPGTKKTPFNGKEVAKRCREETGLPETVVLGLNFLPDPIDVQDLLKSLNRNELRIEEFLAFCADRGLEPSTENERAAAEFLACAAGQAIAWLHLPADKSGLNMAQTLVLWAAQNRMQLRHGDGNYEVLGESQVYAFWPRVDA